MLRIVDRYIIKHYLMFFVASLVVFGTLYIAVDFMTNVAKYTAAASSFIAYYALMTPSVIYQMLPIAFIMAVIFTLSSLNKNSELVAMFSSGYSLARVSAPILICVGIISFASFFVADLVIPKLDKKKDEIYYYKIKKKPWLIATVRKDKIWFRSKNRLFNLKVLNSANSTANGLTLYYFDEVWNLLQVVNAETISMKKGHWVLFDGQITIFEDKNPFPEVRTFSEKTIGVSEEFDVLDANFDSADMMNTAQLRDFISKNREAGLDTTEYEVGFHRKISFAFAGLVLVLMGIPFSTTHQRSGGMGKNIGICILIVFSYWIVYSSFISFGKHGVLPPIIAAWLPNILFFSFAMHSLVKLKK